MKPDLKIGSSIFIAVFIVERTGRNLQSESISQSLDRQQRPIGIAAVEDKVLQQAVVTILNQIYEVDFKGFSYGFRPGRSPIRRLTL